MAVRKSKKNNSADEVQVDDFSQFEGLSIEDAFRQVDKTISILQDDSITLEDSFKKYAEGMELLKYASSRIDQVEKKALVINRNAGLSLFDEEEED